METPFALSGARRRSGRCAAVYAWETGLGGGEAGDVVRPKRTLDPMGISADLRSHISGCASATTMTKTGQATWTGQSAGPPWFADCGAVARRLATIVSSWVPTSASAQATSSTNPAPMIARTQTKTLRRRSHIPIARCLSCPFARHLASRFRAERMFLMYDVSRPVQGFLSFAALSALDGQQPASAARETDEGKTGGRL